MSRVNIYSSEGTSSNTPWCDSGDVFRWFYNYNHTCLFKKKLMDSECVYILGSGKYKGHKATEWVNTAIKRLLYFSYRNCFSPLMNGATTDTSWGCMIRSGQMMLAYAFLRYFNEGNPLLCESLDMLRSKVQLLFFDIPSAPFGIHAVTAMGANHGIPCGKWFGPTPLAASLCGVSQQYISEGGDGPVVIAPPSRSVSIQQIQAILENAQHVLMIFPVMMGISTLSDEYATFLKRCFEMKSSVGVVGGRQGSAYYFCGYQGNAFFCLDPHYVQRALISSESTGTLSGRRHTLQVNQVNTSMLLGFYIASSDDFSAFQTDMERANANLVYPLISFVAEYDSTALDLEKEAGNCVCLIN